MQALFVSLYGFEQVFGMSLKQAFWFRFEVLTGLWYMQFLSFVCLFEVEQAFRLVV